MASSFVRILRHRSTTVIGWSFTVAMAAALCACGGSGDADSAASGAAATPPSQATQTVEIRGAVVKGPVAGAAVCAYAVASTVRGNALGNCATTAADGSYALSVPKGATDILLEAAGGTFVDEATGQTTPLAAGQPMTSLVSGGAAQVDAYITPLTTLAVNTARAAGTLSATGVARAATDVLATLGIDPALDIFRTAPGFGGAANAYGNALAAVSRLVRNGIPLADVLSASNVQALSAAFQAAVADAGGAPPIPPAAPGASGVPAASGALAITGGSTAAFTPDSDGFTVSIDGDRTTYRFEREVSYAVGAGTATSAAYISVTRATHGTAGPLQTTILSGNFAPETGLSGFASSNCSGDCGVRISTPAGATHPVTLTFDNVAMGKLVLNGSLTGDAPGAAWSVDDLPGTTTGSISLGANAARVVTGDVVTGSGPGGTVRTVTLQLAGGAQLVAVDRFSPTGALLGNSASYLAPGGTPSFCVGGCAFTVTASASAIGIAFDAMALSDGAVVNGSAQLGRTQGVLTSPSLGSFTPISDSIQSANDRRTLTFSVLGTAAQGGISLVVVTVDAGSVTEVSVSTGIGAGVFQCFKEAASFLGIPACANVSASADGRSVTFSASTVGGGTVGQRQTAVLTGTLTARGR